MRLLKTIIVASFLLALCQTSSTSVPPPAVSGPPAVPANSAATMIDLLPESTLLAIEINDLAQRWPEIRAVPAISRFLNRLETGSGFAPDVLPRLVGNAAVVALMVPGEDRWVMPVALLRPPDLAQAEEILGDTSFAAGGGAPLAMHRGRGALWVGPPGASDRLQQIATGDGTTIHDILVLDEISRRLPAGGLARGWVNPVALRTLLRRQVEGALSTPLEILRSFALAKLQLIRFVGFRRELTADGVVTDGVIGLDVSALPDQVWQILNSPPESSRLLPSPLPVDTIAASAFTLEAGAHLAWVRHVAAGDPRGPLRNLEFWMAEFWSRTGLDLERDLLGALGEQGWFFLLPGETRETVLAALILETRDSQRVEETLLELRAWFAEHLQSRTLGSVRLRLRDDAVNERIVHSLALWTPFAELPGPAFLITDEYLLVGTGEPALATGLSLLATKDLWRSTHDAAGAEPASSPARYSREHIRIMGPAMASWIEGLMAAESSDHERALISALTGLLGEMGSIEAEIWYEAEAARIRTRIQFAAD